jgi:hypothetical protein
LKVKKEWYNSIGIRTSRRSYEGREIDSDKVKCIENLITEINSESGLSIQLIKNGKEVFNSFKSTYGLITGVKSFIALVGNKDIENVENKLGYFGEFIVLEATKLGLGTCWIGGTYDKKVAQNIINFKDNENMYCIISIGHVKENKNLKEKLVSSFSKNKKTFNEVLISKEKEIPTWVKSGIEAVIKAPSAINKQPWKYSFNQNIVKVYLEKENHGYEHIDVGISMAHFELGAKNENYNGKWEYGRKENFYK